MSPEQVASTYPENKVQLQHVQQLVVTKYFHRFPGNKVTTCCLVLANGHHVVGISACVDPQNFDKSLGEVHAERDAINKVFQLEAYMLQQHLSELGSSAPRAFQSDDPSAPNYVPF